MVEPVSSWAITRNLGKQSSRALVKFFRQAGVVSYLLKASAFKFEIVSVA
jgi:hypothetical protein